MFGKHGVPEYACGANFADFLTLMSFNADTIELRRYYRSCTTIGLERQVGSRYFVTAANATKIFFLKEAAIHFLRYTGKVDSGNKLETSVYGKLLNHTEIACLKADSIMFYHVYADLIMLSKSRDLNKSTLDMNIHYLELKTYLQEVEQHPEIMLDKEYPVFGSEKELYGKNPKINHRLHTKSQCVFEKLFASDSMYDSDTLHQYLAAGAY